MEEAKHSLSVTFLTLTYDQDNLPYTGLGFPTLCKTDLQLFLKRLRKRLNDNHLSYGFKYKRDIPKLKYYACGEYGTKTHRPHYHMILYNLPHMLFSADFIESNWQKGNVTIDPGNEMTFNYVTKYIMKNTFHESIDLVDDTTGEIFPDDRVREFSLMSKKLGSAFLTPQMIKYLQDQQQGFVNVRGHQISLPRYYRDKVFTKTERQTMAALAQQYNEENPRFMSAQHENEWKKDQIRKQKKTLVLERQTL